MNDMARRVSRWLLGHILSSPHDREEQGYPPAGHDDNTSADNPRHKPLTVITTESNELIPQNDKLLVFRSLTGIDTVPALKHAGHANRAAPNIGIYPRVVSAERNASRSYRVFNIAINAFLAFQMIIGASLTALGAANGSRSAVTAFGALNTILADILTYLKGSGLPNKLKYVEDKFKAVREYTEQREREFCLASCPLDPLEEVQIVDEMYRAAKQEFDSSKSPGGHGGGASQHPGVPSSALSSLAQRFSKLTDASTATRVPAAEKV